MAVEAHVTPVVLQWARRRDRLTAEEAAKRLGVPPSRLELWESGEAKPTLAQARRFAERLHVPFGYLYLSAPPADRLALPDLRTLGATPEAPSPDLADLLDDVLRKQAWYREYQQDEGAEPLPFVASFPPDAQPSDVAQDMRLRLDVAAQRAEARSADEFVRLLTRQAEVLGVLVMRSGIVGNNAYRPLSVAEFRGFAISDDLAPLVFINGQDAQAAQVFTLVHELAHIWIGESGVSNPDFRRSSSEQTIAIERVCNRVAADVLVPPASLRARWPDDAWQDQLTSLARFFKVSRFVVLRQAYDLKLVNQADYWSHYETLLDGVSARKSEGGNFYATVTARNSRRFTTALIGAVAEGKVPHLDAARLLNVRVATLDGIAERLVGSRLVG